MAMNILLLIAGTLVNASAAVVILTPIFLPVAMTLGIDPLFFGVLMVVNLAIGCITPPVGLDLFVASAISKVPIERVVKACAAVPLGAAGGAGHPDHVPVVHHRASKSSREVMTII